MAYFGCMGACQPAVAACELTCGKEHPDGWRVAAELLACSTLKCPLESQCSSKDPDACVACANLHCAKLKVACLADVACRQAYICEGDCPGPDCSPDCQEPNPEGQALSEQFTSCWISHCVSECG